MFSVVFVPLFATLISHAAGENVFSAEHRLLAKLFNSSTYDREVFPLKNTTGKLTVHLGLAIIRLGSLDIVKQALTINSWSRFMWHDERLTWDPKGYDMISVIRASNSRVWKPDIALYNSAGGDISLWEGDPQTNVLIYSDGTVLWIPPKRISAGCNIDLMKFPYDSQECIFKLGSWTYDGFRMGIDFYEGRKEIDLTDYVHNREWDVTATNATYRELYYPCCVEPYPYIQFNITFKRKPSAFAHVFVGPAVVLALLIPVTFLMAPETGEKITLSIGILVCLMLMAVLLELYLPTALSAASLLVLYYMSSFIMMAVSLAFTVLTTNMWRNRCGSQPPAALKQVVVGCFGRVLCVDPSNYGRPAQDPTDAGQGDDVKMVQPDNTSNDWRVMSIVMDRLLFVVFLTVVIIMTITMLA